MQRHFPTILILEAATREAWRCEGALGACQLTKKGQQPHPRRRHRTDRGHGPAKMLPPIRRKPLGSRTLVAVITPRFYESEHCPTELHLALLRSHRHDRM